MYNSSNIGNTYEVLMDNLGEKRYFKKAPGVEGRTILKFTLQKEGERM